MADTLTDTAADTPQVQTTALPGLEWFFEVLDRTNRSHNVVMLERGILVSQTAARFTITGDCRQRPAMLDAATAAIAQDRAELSAAGERYKAEHSAHAKFTRTARDLDAARAQETKLAADVQAALDRKTAALENGDDPTEARTAFRDRSIELESIAGDVETLERLVKKAYQDTREQCGVSLCCQAEDLDREAASAEAMAIAGLTEAFNRFVPMLHVARARREALGRPRHRGVTWAVEAMLDTVLPPPPRPRPRPPAPPHPDWTATSEGVAHWRAAMDRWEGKEPGQREPQQQPKPADGRTISQEEFESGMQKLRSNTEPLQFVGTAPTELASVVGQ